MTNNEIRLKTAQQSFSTYKNKLILKGDLVYCQIQEPRFGNSARVNLWNINREELGDVNIQEYEKLFL